MLLHQTFKHSYLVHWRQIAGLMWLMWVAMTLQWQIWPSSGIPPTNQTMLSFNETHQWQQSSSKNSVFAFCPPTFPTQLRYVTHYVETLVTISAQDMTTNVSTKLAILLSSPGCSSLPTQGWGQFVYVWVRVRQSHAVMTLTLQPPLSRQPGSLCLHHYLVQPSRSQFYIPTVRMETGHRHSFRLPMVLHHTPFLSPP